MYVSHSINDRGDAPSFTQKGFKKIHLIPVYMISTTIRWPCHSRTSECCSTVFMNSCYIVLRDVSMCKFRQIFGDERELVAYIIRI